MQWRGAGRLAIAHQFIQIGDQVLLQGKDHPVTVLLVGKMAYHPADAVHGHQTAKSLLFGNAFKAAGEFAPAESQLGN